MPAQSELHQSYVSAVRSLLTPPGTRDDRGGGGPATPGEIEARAREVLRLSGELAHAERQRLEAADPRERAMAAQRLLAKAGTELQISVYLKEAGDDEAAGAPPSPQNLTERSGRTQAQVDEYLGVLAADEAVSPASPDRAGRRLTKEQLVTSACDACDLIAKRAGESAKKAFEGLLGVGLADLGAVAGSVASAVAGSLGAAGGGLSRLYALCRDFVKNVFDSIVALLGDQLAKIIGDKVVAWIKEAKDQHLFGDWLSRAYGVESIKQDLTTRLNDAKAAIPSSFVADALEALNSRFTRDMKLTDKLTDGLGWLKFVPGLSGPEGLLLRAAGYALLLAWAVVDGADYLDSPHLDLIGRIPGVPAMVDASR
jgi:hypothetical protein